jgi:Uma2 family endonuclease
MGGAPRRHSLLCTNLMVGLGIQLAGRGCELHTHDMSVRVDEGRRYVYPDVVVACGKPVYAVGERVLVNPTVVFEVLSPSTAKKDRGWKFEGYRRLESMREIVFVSQDALSVELWRRTPDGMWESHLPLRAPDAVLRLESIGCTLPLSQVYEGLLGEDGMIAGSEARPSGAAGRRKAT